MFRVHAPKLAAHARAGQFLIVRVNETGERVPFTFANWNPEEGWIEFIFMKIGKTTTMLSQLEPGDHILNITGPLGNPTDMGEGNWCILGGGVGLAIAYPVARQLCELGRKVHVIMGARTKDLLLLVPQFEALPLAGLHITTDDGSCGEQGVVTAPLARLCDSGEIDRAFAVGPVPMMKFSSMTCAEKGIPIMTSLNPIMVDGTGMCGCCRVEVDGQTRFACVDGPEFDGTKVNWADLQKRQATYRDEEAMILSAFQERGCECQ